MNVEWASVHKARNAYKLRMSKIQLKCSQRLTIYAVANKEARDEANTADIESCSPERKTRINVVAIDVRVMATLIAAAMHKTANWTGIAGIKNAIALPNDAPVVKRGKIKPPRYPPTTVKDIATSLVIPTIKHVSVDSISNPMRPLVGHT